jgi:hypothetical protein
MAKNNQIEKQSSHVELVWGSAILDDGFTTMPNMITRNYRRLGMTHGEYSFISLLATFKHDVNDPYPSQETLAALYFADSYEEGKSERAIRKIVKSLKDKSLLRIGKRRNKASGEWASAVYSLKPLIDACLKLQGSKKEAVETEFDVIWDDESPEEQKVPTVSTQKVPLVQEQKVPTKIKRKNNNFKNIEEEDKAKFPSQATKHSLEISQESAEIIISELLASFKEDLQPKTAAALKTKALRKVREGAVHTDFHSYFLEMITRKIEELEERRKKEAQTKTEQPKGERKSNRKTTRKEHLPEWFADQKATDAEKEQAAAQATEEDKAELEAIQRQLLEELQGDKKETVNT